ncbi:MAG: ABC transporter permease subunit, partial [Salinibacter sp.]
GAMVIGLGIGGGGLIAGVGFGGARQYVLFLFASVAVAAVFLGISVLVSTLVQEKTQALGVVLIVWLWFVLLHDLVALGLVAAMNVPSPVLTGLALLNPVDVFRLLMLSQLETTTGGFATLLTAANLSMPLLLGGLAVWLLVPVLLATLVIRRHRP